MDLEEALKLIEKQKQDLAKHDAEQQAMQGKLDELLAETKKAKAKAKEEAEAASAALQDKAKAEGDYKQLYESSQNELAEYKSKTEQLEMTIASSAKHTEAVRLAGQLTKDTARAELLAEKIEARLKLVDGGLKVLNDEGQLTISSVEDLTSDIKKKYDFLIDGNQASGGGAPGANGSAANGKNPFKKGEDFNLTEQARILKTDPVLAQTLRDAAQ